MVAIDSAKVGPFDLGTVVIRSAIRVNRRNAQVSIDSAGSDPIPHILDGFPLRLRDIRVYIDRPDFMVNPTTCDPFAVTSTLTGAGRALLATRADDSTSAAPTAPFQVSNCSALGFAPEARDRTSRAATSAATTRRCRRSLTPRHGDANIGKATVTLPPQLFLAQEHLETVCTPAPVRRPQLPEGLDLRHAPRRPRRCSKNR